MCKQKEVKSNTEQQVLFRKIKRLRAYRQASSRVLEVGNDSIGALEGKIDVQGQREAETG